MEQIFSERLKELRQDKNISQVELAKKIGVGKSIISKWEKGECDITLSKAKVLAIFFGVSIDYLAGLED